jgi:hypothetical protein
MKCPKCTAEVPDHLERCHVCGTDVGFPNVRIADSDKEVSALAKRLDDARTSATARDCSDALNDFGRASARSSAVVARPLGDLDSFVKRDNALYTSFHSQVRSGARLPESNEWDKGRRAAESTINPLYDEQINYAALSLDGFGVLWWGEYSISLKELHIASRTSVFDENPFLFCSRHRVVAGQAPPAGYRATWSRRHELAMAKLEPKMTPITEPSSYASILLHQGTAKEDADFIECHVYGPIHRNSIERVIGPRPKGGPDLVIWKSVVGQLQKLGALVEEV